MIRLLIIAGLAYIGYRKLKSLSSRNLRSDGDHSGREDAEAEDVMLQDPHCKTYFPKREGVHLRIDGKDYYFCCKECRNKFIAEHLNK